MLHVARGELDPGFFLDPRQIQEEFGHEDLLALTPRSLHREFLRRVAEPDPRFLPPRDSCHEISIEEDRAEVSWPEQDARVFLARERGRWRVEAWGLASPGAW